MNIRRLISRAACLLVVLSGTHAKGQVIATVAGTGTGGYGTDGGLAFQTMINNPYAVASDAQGNIYFTDFANNRIRMVNPCGIISNVAGNGLAGNSGNGLPATSSTVRLNGPAGITIDGSGNIYFSDYNGKRIRMISSSTGFISSFAGIGTFGNNGDNGPATLASFDAPTGIVADAAGNIYFADIAHNRIRKISTSGTITHFAGAQDGTAGLTGDGGQATAAFLNQPQGLTVDASGNIYVADAGNNKVRKITVSTGIITTVAGNGSVGYTGDGSAATNATLSGPTGVYVDASNNLFIADFGNNVIRKVSGTTISTYAGTGSSGYSGDQGSATAAKLNGPFGLGGSTTGILYVTDSANERIREVFNDVGPKLYNGNSVSFSLCQNAAALPINSYLTATDTISGQVITWTTGSAPRHGTLVTGASATATGCGQIMPSGITYTPGNGFFGNDTFVVKVTDGFRYDSATVIVTVNPLPNTGTISGSYSLCLASTITFTETVSGGTWSLSNGNATASPIAATNNVAVTSVANGLDTLSYSLTSSEGCVASTSKVFVINPYVSPISGAPSGQLCTGIPVALTDSVATGTWSSSDTSIAKVLNNGVVTPVNAGVVTIQYTIVACGSLVSTSKTLTVNTTPTSGTITGPGSVCITAASLFTSSATGGNWTLSNGSATVDGSGNVTGQSAGIDTLSYTVNTAYCTSTTTQTFVVAPYAGKITAPSIACWPNSYTFTESVPGGHWFSSDTNIVMIDSLTGNASTQTPGVVIISYVQNGVCASSVSATKTITVNISPVAPAPIVGPDTVCLNSTISLSDITGTGVWTRFPSSGGTIAKVGTTDSATFQGLTAGTTTIDYTVSASGCSANVTKPVFVKTKPTVPAITGLVNTCIGTGVDSLANALAGGFWTSNDTTIAKISATGMISGMAAGSVIISYTDSNNCGPTTVTKSVTINPIPDAGIVTGSTMVCQGATDTLTPSVPGGYWVRTNTNAYVAGGVVTGNSAGFDTIYYRVHTAYCGDDTVTIPMTVSPLPQHGGILGSNYVCTGAYDTLKNTAYNGNTTIWKSLNPAGATITTLSDSSAVVRGITSGTDTIRFIVSNVCGIDSVQKYITVRQSPDAGSITGGNLVCTGATDTLKDLTANLTGGVWLRKNSFASILGIDSVTGVVTGVSQGTDTIMFKLSTINCGIDTAFFTVSVKPSPNAGTITGLSTICVNTPTTYTDASSSGGTVRWYSKYPFVANIVASSGVATGIAAGSDSVIFVVTSTNCGTDTAFKAITVMQAPYSGLISATTQNVCVGDTIVLTDPVQSYQWSASNNKAKVTDTFSVATVSNAHILGMSAGLDTIKCSSTNACGTGFDTIVVRVMPLADAGIINGSSTLCQSDTLTYHDTTSGGTWIMLNSIATITTTGRVKAISSGTDSILYVVTNNCSTDTTWKKITIAPLPHAGAITGPSQLCKGALITLTDTASGGVWSHLNTHTAINSQGLVIGNTVGKDTIRYRVTNSCGSDTAKKIITVNAMPVVPSITTHTFTNVCLGTMYQNFGADTLPVTGVTFAWTAVNADIYATGNSKQYCLVNFPDSGTSTVQLLVNITATGCKDSTSFTVNVSSSNSTPSTQIIYNTSEFFFLDNTATTYQWGYDDVFTKDSTKLSGEINQNYYNPSPDYSHKNYWVITKYGNCYQKTYYNTPSETAIVGTASAVNMEVYPNPASELLNIQASGLNFSDDNKLIIMDLAGHIILTQTIIETKSTVSIEAMPAGFYLVALERNGVRVTTKPVVKN